MIPIILTGTIIPNAIKTVHRNWKVRRNEYLDTIRYYKKFSKVYFIENSYYDLSHDSEFSNDEKFQYFKFEASEQFERGKGYQEFQMLDEFVKHKLNEDCFVKVTGRYIYKNFGDLFSFLIRNKDKYDLIIDAFIRSKTARTSLFYVKKNAYLKRLQDSYLEMDDSVGVWAEHIIYRALKNFSSYTFFPKVPILNATSGSTGGKLITNENIVKIGIKNVQRKLFLVLRIRQLLR